jgi:Fe2+ or Zn2+ uptake regulation protein
VQLVSELETKTGYQIEHHTLEFSGTCPSCQRKPSQSR